MNARTKIGDAFTAFHHEIVAMEQHMQRQAYVMDLMINCLYSCKKYVMEGGPAPVLTFAEDGGMIPENVQETQEALPTVLTKHAPPPMPVPEAQFEDADTGNPIGMDDDYPWTEALQTRLNALKGGGE